MLFKCQPADARGDAAAQGFQRTFGIDAIGSTQVYDAAILSARQVDGERMSLKVIQLAQFGLTESGEPLLQMARPGKRMAT